MLHEFFVANIIFHKQVETSMTIRTELIGEHKK